MRSFHCLALFIYFHDSSHFKSMSLIHSFSCLVFFFPAFRVVLPSSYLILELKSLAKRTNGECEVVYCDSISSPQFAAELTCKIGRHLSRITKPDHGDVEINWGALIPTMLSQTPSETLKYIHFNNGGVYCEVFSLSCFCAVSLF
jgi:hypothetical protein